MLGEDNILSPELVMHELLSKIYNLKTLLDSLTGSESLFSHRIILEDRIGHDLAFPNRVASVLPDFAEAVDATWIVLNNLSIVFFSPEVLRPVTARPVHPDLLVRDCMQALEPLAQRMKVSFQLDSTPEEWNLYCDSKLLWLAIYNLLHNAVIYTSPSKEECSSKTVRVFLRKHDSQGSLSLEVTSSGAEISLEELHSNRLFDAGYRGETSRRMRIGGLGIGLTVALKIAKSCRGDVRINSHKVSESGAVTTVSFIIRQPVAQERGARGNIDSLG